MKIVVDCANGATYKSSPLILQELGAEVVAVNCQPDGRNINRRCGSVHPEVVQKAVMRHGADAGLTHDGDGDRVLLVDEKGSLVDGDHILAICALDRKGDRRLAGKGVVATVMSNYGLEETLSRAGIPLFRTQVGDRYVVEEMLRSNCHLGGEQSGHIIFLDYQTTGDGIVSALQVLAVMKRRGRPLSRLASCMKQYPQVLVNVEVKKRAALEDLPEVTRSVAVAEKRLAGRGRVLVRFSGTEPKVRVMVEGPNRRTITALAGGIAATVVKSLQG